MAPLWELAGMWHFAPSRRTQIEWKSHMTVFVIGLDLGVVLTFVVCGNGRQPTPQGPGAPPVIFSQQSLIGCYRLALALLVKGVDAGGSYPLWSGRRLSSLSPFQGWCPVSPFQPRELPAWPAASVKMLSEVAGLQAPQGSRVGDLKDLPVFLVAALGPEIALIVHVDEFSASVRVKVNAVAAATDQGCADGSHFGSSLRTKQETETYDFGSVEWLIAFFSLCGTSESSISITKAS